MLFEGRYNASKQLHSQRHYIWLNDTPVGFVVKNNNSEDWNIYAIHTDHLNTPRLVTNQNGAEVWRWASDAFGESAAVGSIEFNLRFPGQYYDVESGLHYNYFRDYNAQIGRYVQSDPIGLQGGLNTYVYVGGNPVNYVDPLGLYGFSDFVNDVNYVGQFIGGSSDFASNFIDQEMATHIHGKWPDGSRGWANQDKYFHCKANCEAAQRGPGGEAAAQCMSDFREATDQFFGDTPEQSREDQWANQFGREEGQRSPTESCRTLCAVYHPGGNFPY